MGEYMEICNWTGAAEEDMQMNFGKRNKLYPMHENEYCGDVEVPENAMFPAAFLISRWCSNEDERMSLGPRDLENVNRPCKSSRTIDGFCSKRETTVTEQLQLMGSPSASREKPKSSSPMSRRRKISSSAVKVPPAAELDEFFAEAEEYVQKRFAEKYNYDISKDFPLEGRYEWVALHP